MTRGDIALAVLGLASVGALGAVQALRRAHRRLARDLDRSHALHRPRPVAPLLPPTAEQHIQTEGGRGA